MIPDVDPIIAIWQPRYNTQLGAEDAREIAHNVQGFFEVLSSWASQDAAASAPPVEPVGTPAPKNKRRKP